MKLDPHRITFEKEFSYIETSKDSEKFLIQFFSHSEVKGFLSLLDFNETYLCSLELCTDKTLIKEKFQNWNIRTFFNK